MRCLALVSFLPVLLVSCGSAEPLDLTRSYTVTRIEGGAPPQLVIATDGCDVTVGGGYLSFTADDQFELGLDAFTDCTRGGGIAAGATYRYLGTATISGPRINFHVERGGSPPDFEGVGVDAGPITVDVPELVPLADQVSVEFGAK